MTQKIQDALTNAVKLGLAALTLTATVTFVICVYIGSLWAMGYTIQVKAINYRDRKPAETKEEEAPAALTPEEPRQNKRVPSSTPTPAEIRVTA